jgi:hypothetical protein
MIIMVMWDGCGLVDIMKDMAGILQGGMVGE